MKKNKLPKVVEDETENSLPNFFLQTLSDFEMPSTRKFMSNTLSNKSAHSQSSSHSQISLKYSRDNLSDKPSSKKLTSLNNFIKEESLKQSSKEEASLNQQIQKITQNIGFTSLKHSKPKKKINQQLKEKIKKQKVQNICDTFIQKIRRNNIFSIPVDLQVFKTSSTSTILDYTGYQLNSVFENVIALISILQTFALFLVYTLCLIFPELSQTSEVRDIHILCLVLSGLEMMISSLTIKSFGGKKLKKFRQIWLFYGKDSFIIDAINICTLIMNISASHIQLFQYLKLFIIAKLPQCLDKLERLEIYFIKNYYNEQYWSLLKVLFFNFCFAHILATFLISMASIDDRNNWMVTRDIASKPWFEKYVWSYYWSTTIMLTVGFGDIVPTTYKEALCLIFIEMTSCIVLAYNVNCVGSLISNIRSQDTEKTKKFKTFKQLTEKNHLPEDLTWKINNYIDESAKIKKKFNLEEENQFVQTLPSGFKTQFLKESNKNIFKNLPFFKNLVNKTLFALAEKIETRISHPMQIIRKHDDNYNLLILKSGQIGFTCKKLNCKFNGETVDQLQTKQSQPILLGLQFITKKRSIYEIKSLIYSVLYFLDYENVIEILKASKMDYEFYAFLRDKSSKTDNEYEILLCSSCKKYHTKFTCPKLHFTPNHQIILSKHVFRGKHNTQKRNSSINRLQISSCKKHPTLTKYQITKYIYKSMVTVNNTLQESRFNFLNIFADRLKSLKLNSLNQQQSELTQSQVNDELLKKMVDAVKTQIHQISANSFENDEVWLLNCDQMKDYKNYFPQNNSSNLQQKFPVLERLQKLFEKQNKKYDKYFESETQVIVILPEKQGAVSEYSLNKQKCE